MKMRWMMAIVAALAVSTWLAIPAARIWLDPTLRDHTHSIEVPAEYGRLVDLHDKTIRVEVYAGSQELESWHVANYWTTYRELLLHGRPYDPSKCFGRRPSFSNPGISGVEGLKPVPSIWLKSHSDPADQSDTSR